MRFLHPTLVVQASNKDLADILEDTELPDEESKNMAARDAWLVQVKGRVTLCEESGRLAFLPRLYTWLTTEHAVGRKIMIFSQYLKFRDIVQESLKRGRNVECPSP